MDLSEAVVANIIGILALGALVGLLATSWVAAGFTTAWAAALSFWGWVIYVVVHFIQKFW